MGSHGSALCEGLQAQLYLVPSASIHLRKLALMDIHVTMTIHSCEEYYHTIQSLKGTEATAQARGV